jgi:MFS family permease
MIAPASDKLAAEFGIESSVIIALTTSIFVLAYGKLSIYPEGGCAHTQAAFGPLFLGPLSEIFGRSRVLQIANLWYLGTYAIIARISFLRLMASPTQYGTWHVASHRTLAN